MRTVLPLLVVSLVLTMACRRPHADPPRAGRADRPGSRAGEASTARPGSLRSHDPPRRWLVAVAHEPTSKVARFQPIELATGCQPAAPAATAPALALPAMPYRNWPDHYQVVAAVGGERLVVAEPVAASFGGAPPSWQLTEHPLGRAGRRPAIPLAAARPAALHVVGSTVYLGTDGRVGMVDLGAPRPTLATVHQRSPVEKPYDLFVRDRDMLVAIDDEVAPVYADTFRLADRGHLEHVAGWDMPGVINGSYVAAVLAMDHGDAGTLYALAPYGILAGHGHDLVALPLRRGQAQFRAGMILQNAGRADGVLEEHVPRGGGPQDRPTLVAGSQFTPWTGLALLRPGAGGDGRLAVAASSRGLILLPLDLRAALPATAVDLGGPCLDVVGCGDGAVALVGDDPKQPGERGPRTRLLSVRWNGKTLERLGETTMAGAWRALLR